MLEKNSTAASDLGTLKKKNSTPDLFKGQKLHLMKK